MAPPQDARINAAREVEASCKISYKGCTAREEARAKRFGTKATRFDPITIAIRGAHGPKMSKLLKRMQGLHWGGHIRGIFWKSLWGTLEIPL